APALALVLISVAASRGGLERTEADPVSPWVVAAITLLGAVWLGWRAVTQAAVFDRDGLRSRNVTGTLRVGWADVEELRVATRTGVSVVEARVVGVRRWARIGAATRFAGEGAEEVRRAIERHGAAGALLDPGWP
ncbi:MAG: hypothetical protein ACK4V6_02725, partial [Microthrixaceae bacterium]